MFSFVLLFRNKLYNIQKLYKKLWNRNDKKPKKIKYTTFRAASSHSSYWCLVSRDGSADYNNYGYTNGLAPALSI